MHNYADFIDEDRRQRCGRRLRENDGTLIVVTGAWALIPARDRCGSGRDRRPRASHQFEHRHQGGRAFTAAAVGDAASAATGTRHRAANAGRADERPHHRRS